MKKLMINFMAVIMMTVCAWSVSSCSDDDDDNGLPTITELNGTTWVEQSRWDDGSSISTTLTFSGAKASLVTEYVDTDGSSFKNPKVEYTYRRSNNLVVFTPTENGKATLEGLIQEEVKMTITNTSNNKVIYNLYKK